MSSFKNMKIAITLDQPIDDVVKELERLGYVLDNQFHSGLDSKSILTWDNGSFEGYRSDLSNLHGSQVVNLTELKEMDGER